MKDRICCDLKCNWKSARKWLLGIYLLLVPSTVVACMVLTIIFASRIYSLDAMKLVQANPTHINIQDIPFEYKHNIDNTILKYVQDHSVGRVKRRTDEEELFTTGTRIYSNVTARAYTSMEQQITTTQAGKVDKIDYNTEMITQEFKPSASTLINILMDSANSSMDGKPVFPTSFSANINVQTESSLIDPYENVETSTLSVEGKETRFCRDLDYFIEQHRLLAKESGLDWYKNTKDKVTRLRKCFASVIWILFYTLLHCVCLCVCGLSWVEKMVLIVFLNIEYSIQLPLLARTLAYTSGSNGLRCFVCRMINDCDDLDPWDLAEKLPGEEESSFHAIMVSFAVLMLLNFIFLIIMAVFTDALYDFGKSLDKSPLDDSHKCVIRSSTLQFALKVMSWISIMPVMSFTPLTGVIVFTVLPVTNVSSATLLVFSIIFYSGVGCWSLLFLGFFIALTIK